MRLVCCLTLLFLAACSSTPPYKYRYIPGKTAVLDRGVAIAPPNAPPEVQSAIAAGNRIAGLPYQRGGGHGKSIAKAYDCSGASSFLLNAAGCLDSPAPSKLFRNYGQKGEGEWISIYARKDHVFLVVAGLRFDTGWGNGAQGPQWSTRTRPAVGFVIRHPVSL